MERATTIGGTAQNQQHPAASTENLPSTNNTLTWKTESLVSTCGDEQNYPRPYLAGSTADCDHFISLFGELILFAAPSPLLTIMRRMNFDAWDHDMLALQKPPRITLHSQLCSQFVQCDWYMFSFASHVYDAVILSIHLLLLTTCCSFSTVLLLFQPSTPTGLGELYYWSWNGKLRIPYLSKCKAGQIYPAYSSSFFNHFFFPSFPFFCIVTSISLFFSPSCVACLQERFSGVAWIVCRIGNRNKMRALEI